MATSPCQIRQHKAHAHSTLGKYDIDTKKSKCAWKTLSQRILTWKVTFEFGWSCTAYTRRSCDWRNLFAAPVHWFGQILTVSGGLSMHTPWVSKVCLSSMDAQIYTYVPFVTNTRYHDRAIVTMLPNSHMGTLYERCICVHIEFLSKYTVSWRPTFKCLTKPFSRLLLNVRFSTFKLV